MSKVSTRDERLDAAIADLDHMRAEWEKIGKPLTIRTASLDVRPHPLVRMIAEKEEMVERMSRPLEAARGGRPPGSVSAPDRTSDRASGPPKRSSLKAVA